MRYSLNPLTQRNHFGHIGGVNFNLLFSLRKAVPAFITTNEECQAHLIKGSTYKNSSQIGDLSLPTIVCSGSQCSFLETLLKKMRRFYLTGTISGSVKLGSVVFSSLIWNIYFPYHICSPCLFSVYGQGFGQGTDGCRDWENI